MSSQQQLFEGEASKMNSRINSQQQFLESEASKMNSRIDNWCETTLKQVKELQRDKCHRETEMQKEFAGIKVQLTEQKRNYHQIVTVMDDLSSKFVELTLSMGS